MDFKDKIVVITGSLRPLSRKDAIRLLEARGAIVHTYISAATNILITGHRQLDLFQPEKRSKKYQAAMRRIAEGQVIEIVTQDRFFQLVKESQR
ncbi:BRCT domain-containing protein [Streptococcus danieliae]|uniref:BRCT domain-containing protein n=1 Tax=Streptococcus danieliae TaxID=747656 RepID=A0A7Z0M734_9STRE|nr:BRCT domain-containing protein [Streptococcus danieliae]MBF0699499.1 BRCT domain-containing protein [Streptococcus danieliae]MCU0081855.1 BRCT domain-containing protein [Streptococcus danieliae]NYS96675.1 BRCT domain-containing protein [Streptococcus danieliae]